MDYFWIFYDFQRNSIRHFSFGARYQLGRVLPIVTSPRGGGGVDVLGRQLALCVR